MRIPKLSLIIEIDEELIEIFKVKCKAQLLKDDEIMNQTCDVCKVKAA